jgi:hypothetical protein
MAAGCGDWELARHERIDGGLRRERGKEGKGREGKGMGWDGKVKQRHNLRTDEKGLRTRRAHAAS